MKKHILNFSIIAISIVLYTACLVSCQKEPNPQTQAEEPVIVEDDPDENGTRQAVTYLHPIYYRMKCIVPANFDFNTNQKIYYVFIEQVPATATFLNSNPLVVDAQYSLDELKKMKAKSFTIKKENFGKIVAKKIEDNMVAFLQYDPIKKRAWVFYAGEEPNWFDAPNNVRYTTSLYLFNWSERPRDIIWS